MGATPNPARVARTGAAVVVLYVIVAVATLALSGRTILPLFEGIGPLTPYRWVDPPPEFAAGNVPPTVDEVEITLGESGSPAAGPGTDDAQVLLALPGDAIPPRAGDTGALVRFTPLAPGDLAPLPDGLRPDGNGYRVDFLYQPSGTQVETLAREGNVVLSVPEPAATMVYSADGQAWERLPTTQLAGSVSIAARLTRPGHYMAAAFANPDGSSASDAVEVLAVAAVTVALALLLVAAPAVVRRVRGGDGEE